MGNQMSKFTKDDTFVRLPELTLLLPTNVPTGPSTTYRRPTMVIITR